MYSRRFLSLSVFFVIALTALLPLPASAQDRDDRDAPGELVITLEPGVSIEQIETRYRTETIASIPGTTTFRVRARKAKKILKRLNRDNSVRKASRDSIVRRQQTVGFPHDRPDVIPSSEGPEQIYRSQIEERGQLETLQIDSANALTESGDEIVIAVLDTGIDATHPVFADRIWTNTDEIPDNDVDDDGDGYVDDCSGWNFVDSTPDTSESLESGSVAGHGTFIAGLMALTAPKARIMPLKVLGSDGIGSAFDASAAINYAAQHGARVVSMSFGADGDVPPAILVAAVESARALGLVLVAAVGNDASDHIAYPASDTKNVISVGATDTEQNRADFSNYAPDMVDVWAPGTQLVSPVPGTYDDGSPRFAVWAGTSFSTALVSAGCSVLLSTAAVSDPSDVRERIRSNGPDNADGTGKQVNFFEAVGSILRDSGALDVWSASTLFPLNEGSPAYGYVVLRTIGEAQRLTAYAVNMGAYETYDFYVSSDAAPDTFVKVNTVAPITADDLGNIKFVATGTPRPGDPTPQLPIPLDEIYAVAFATTAGNATIAARVDPMSESVAVWAGVGLRSDDPDNFSFGRAWYGYDPREEGANQGFAVATCGVKPLTDYVLSVNGRELVRHRSSDIDGEINGVPVGSIDFYFSNNPYEIENNGAIPMTPETTPQIYPATQIRRVELFEVSQNGTVSRVPTVTGTFSGPGQKMLSGLR